MASSRDLPKMARQQCSVALWIEIALVWTSMVWYGLVWYGFVWYDFVWFDYNGLS